MSGDGDDYDVRLCADCGGLMVQRFTCLGTVDPAMIGLPDGIAVEWKVYVAGPIEPCKEQR